MQYKVEYIYMPDGVERENVREMEQVLNECAKEGWRVVAITPCATHNFDEKDIEFHAGTELLVTFCREDAPNAAQEG